MTKKQASDLRKMLDKAKLSGWDLGRLVLLDNVEVDHQRPGILGPEDIRAVQRKVDVLGLKDAADFNRLQGLYRIAVYTRMEAEIEGLKAVHALTHSASMLKRFIIEDSIRQVMMFALPAIVTQKQLDELTAKERAFKLAERKKLRHVLEEIVHGLAPKEAVDRWRNPGEEETTFTYLTDFLADSPRPEDRAIVAEAAQQLLRYIRAKKIQPVLLPEKAIRKLKQQEAKRDEMEAGAAEGYWPADEAATWADARMSLIQEAYTAGRKQMTAKKLGLITGILGRIADGSFLQGWGDAEDDLLEYAFITGEEEYQAGVAVWKQFVDTFHGDYTQEAFARPGYVQSLAGWAIYQGDMVDERGYFDDKASRMLADVSGLARYQKLRQEQGKHITMDTMMSHASIVSGIKSFLAIRLTLDAVSAVVGIELGEDLVPVAEQLELAVDLYNAHTQDGAPHYLGLPKLKAIKLGKIKPTAQSLRYYRERMALSLGEGWYLPDAFKELEFEAEPGSLSEDVVKDLVKHLRRKQQGEDHGQEE